MDDYGGGDYGLVDHVEELLYQILKKLEKKSVPVEYREELQDEIFPYIESSNAGLDDALYGVVYGCCYNNDDLCDLAERFEDIGRDWPISHARRIYRRIGDKKKYLELRMLKMEYGGDYHDLATWYWENGEKDKALKVARKGLKQGTGRMEELRLFLADRAKESGDRRTYLQLQFEQTVDRLTLKGYQAFKKLCTKDEWSRYEDQILKRLDKAWGNEKIKIHMQRKEYDNALETLLQEGYPYNSYDSEYVSQVAVRLEKRYPEKILHYYLSGLGHLNRSLTRKEYAQKAKVMKKVRHMYVNVIKNSEKWTSFARKVKLDNKRRPAFQEEFENTVPGWKSL